MNNTTPAEQSPPMTSLEPRQRLKDMSEAERRQYNRERKAASRERARIKRAQNIRAVEYTPPEEWTYALDKFIRETEQAIRVELGSISVQDESIIAMAAECSMALDKGYVTTVNDPYGAMAGRYFPESVAATTVEYVYRYPALLESGTFNNIYDQLLRAVVKWADKNPRLADEKCITDVRAALDGTYTLPPAPQIPRTPEPIAPESPVPSFSRILEQGRNQLLDRLSHIDPNLPPDARRYLNGN